MKHINYYKWRNLSSKESQHWFAHISIWESMIMKLLMICTLIPAKLLIIGELVYNDNKVRRIIRSLSKSWEVKVTTLNELNDSKEMNFIAFMGTLKTHEMKLKAGEQQEPQRKKSVAFKVSPGSSDDKEDPKWKRHHVHGCEESRTYILHERTVRKQEELVTWKETRQGKRTMLSLQKVQTSDCRLLGDEEKTSMSKKSFKKTAWRLHGMT